MPSAEQLPLVDDFAELVRLVEERGHLFLRYSRGPDDDAAHPTSHDYESGLDMPGLSVTTIVPEPWWTRPQEDWVARRVCKYAAFGEQRGKFPWLLTGDVIGYGPDHEPLVADYEPVARVGPRALTRAKELYRERFDIPDESGDSPTSSETTDDPSGEDRAARPDAS